MDREGPKSELSREVAVGDGRMMKDLGPLDGESGR